MSDTPLILPTKEAKDALDQAIGYAMGRWQYIENALFVLLHCLMEAPYTTSSVVFFHIRSAESKFSLTDKFVTKALSADDYKTLWKPIRKDFDELARFRNSLAHFEVIWVDVNYAAGKTKYPIALCANHLDLHRQDAADNSLFVEAILEGGDVLAAYARRVLLFTVQVVPDTEQRVTQLPQGLQRVLEKLRNTPAPGVWPPQADPARA